MAWGQGDYPAAQAWLEECAALARERADQSLLALALNNLGNVALCQCRLGDARSFYGEAADASGVNSATRFRSLSCC